MMARRIIKILLPAVILISGCYYDNEEDLYPSNPCVTEDMSYANDIAPIIQANCFACHSTGSNLAGILLDSYSGLKQAVDNGRLLGAINHLSGFSPMPKDASKLSACNIQKIESWVNAGTPNN